MGIPIPPTYYASIVVVVSVHWPVPKATLSALVELVTSTAVLPSPQTPINNPASSAPVLYYISLEVVVVVICPVPKPNPTPAHRLKSN